MISDSNYNGIKIIPMDDNDSRFKDTSVGDMVTDGINFYVRKSVYPKIKEQLNRLIEENSSGT